MATGIECRLPTHYCVHSTAPITFSYVAVRRQRTWSGALCIWAVRHQPWEFSPCCRSHCGHLSGCGFAFRAPCTPKECIARLMNGCQLRTRDFRVPAIRRAPGCHWRVDIPTLRLETSEGVLLSCKPGSTRQESRGVLRIGPSILLSGILSVLAQTMQMQGEAGRCRVLSHLKPVMPLS